MPDLRGLFLPGYGSQSYAQVNGTTVGVTSTLHSSGALGQVQGDASKNMQGEFYGDLVMSSGVFQDASTGDSRTRAIGVGSGLYSSLFNASRVVPTAPENRPVNQAVRYLMRARR